eukprot:Seg2686.10 transcript_id=Seg2686.10/GoldUCD/mRNA.D3Y31 product="hypothetical protein" protein_id=Seg2686.10/GoldUCD/D3Y31
MHTSQANASVEHIREIFLNYIHERIHILIKDIPDDGRREEVRGKLLERYKQAPEALSPAQKHFNELCYGMEGSHGFLFQCIRVETMIPEDICVITRDVLGEGINWGRIISATTSIAVYICDMIGKESSDTDEVEYIIMLLLLPLSWRVTKWVRNKKDENIKRLFETAPSHLPKHVARFTEDLSLLPTFKNWF